MVKIIQHLPPFMGHQIDVLRLDMIHPLYGGNKYFKLKYNISNAIEEMGSESDVLLLTFGGAHSNHIYSTAAFCNQHQLKVIGVIRGESDLLEQSPTLQFAEKQGMKLHFISRERYRNKTDDDFMDELKNQFGTFYLIPEGGNNVLGIKGCSEILNEVPEYDYVFCACGTACTYTGILAAARPGQITIGISVLKGENTLISEVNKHSPSFQFLPIEPYQNGKITKPTIIDQYHFGGYAKHTEELLKFKKEFEKEHNIPLDYVYTSKLVYAVYDLIKKDLLLNNKSVLIVHSGGQQGNQGYEIRYKINM